MEGLVIGVVWLVALLLAGLWALTNWIHCCRRRREDEEAMQRLRRAWEANLGEKPEPRDEPDAMTQAVIDEALRASDKYN